MNTDAFTTSGFPGITFLTVRSSHELSKVYEASSKDGAHRLIPPVWGSTGGC